MERQSDCLSLPAASSHHFGPKNAAGKCLGAGDYRAGWYLLDDDLIELDEAIGWELLTHASARSENQTVSLSPEPVLP